MGARHSGHFPPVRTNSFAHFEQSAVTPAAYPCRLPASSAYGSYLASDGHYDETSRSDANPDAKVVVVEALEETAVQVKADQKAPLTNSPRLLVNHPHAKLLQFHAQQFHQKLNSLDFLPQLQQPALPDLFPDCEGSADSFLCVQATDERYLPDPSSVAAQDFHFEPPVKHLHESRYF
nr:hypothetical protein Iba_chr01bCG13770 [Ipomoea batatas]